MLSTIIAFAPIVPLLILLIILILYMYLSNRKYAKFIINYTKKFNYKLWEKDLEIKYKKKSFINFKNQVKKINELYDLKLPKSKKISNVFEIQTNDSKIIIFSYTYVIVRKTFNFKVAIINFPNQTSQIPEFTLIKKIFLFYIFKRNCSILTKYRLITKNELLVKKILIDEKLNFLKENSSIYSIEFKGNNIYYLEKKPFSKNEEDYESFISRVKKLKKLFQN